MKKGIYEQPRITIYEVETTAILAGSGEVPSEKGSNNIVVFLTIQYYCLSLRHE